MQTAPPDPFALPSGVKFRFVLAVTALVGTMVFVHNLVYFTFSPDRDRAITVYRQCAAAPAEQGSGADALSSTHAFLTCIAPYEREKAWWILAGILSLAVTATAIYLLTPRFLIDRAKMESLSPYNPDHAWLLGQLYALCREAGLRQPPEFLVTGPDPRYRTVDARAFGRHGRRRVALFQGTIASYGKAPHRSRAVVLHELAHLRNKDTGIFYFTVALVLAFVPTGLLPLAVALIGTPAEGVFSVAWRALALVLLVWVTCASVLRAREYGADVRAASWGVGQGLLETVCKGTGERAPWWRRGPLAWHPPPTQRAAEIGSPREMFRLGFAECFASGLAVSVAANGLLILLWLTMNRLDALDARWTIALLCTPAALAVVGLGIWRAVLYAGNPSTVLLPGLGLALGLVVGQPLALQNGIVLMDRPWMPGPAAVLWSVVLCVLVVALVAWMARSALVWFGTELHPPGKAWSAGLLAAALPFAVLLGGWMFLYDMADELGPIHASARDEFHMISAVAPVGPFWLWASVEHPLLLWFTQWTPLVGAVVVVWLFPIAALWRRRLPGDVAWFRGALTTSLLAAGGFASFQLVLRLALHHGVSQEVRSQDGFVLAFVYWQIGAAVLLQGVAAAATVFVRRRHGWLAVPFGLLTAYLTGCLLTLLLFSGVVLAGCVDVLALAPGPCSLDLPPSLVRNTLLRVLVGGFLCVLLGVAVALVLARLRAERPAAPPPVPGHAPGVSHPIPPVPLQAPVAHLHTRASERRRRLAIGSVCLSAALVLAFSLAVGPTEQAQGSTPDDASPPAATPTVSSATTACQDFDDLLGSMDSLTTADVYAGLYEATQLARLAGNTRLASAFQGLLVAAQDQDPERLHAATEDIRTQCAIEGAPLRNLP
ncbi:M48 family metalloprotease [Streptomyces sp. NPDC054834]